MIEMMGTNRIGIEDECIKVYDPTTKTLIATYDSYKEASKKLYIPIKKIRDAALHKTRRFSKSFNKDVAIRIANKNKK
jgi:hypothetical protein